MITVRFTLNGKKVVYHCDEGESCQHFLQRHRIASVRNSDDSYGFAGSDTILLDGKIVGANLLIAPQLEGRNVKTIEAFCPGGELSFVQKALVETGCVQSGYNSPAAALMIHDLLERIPNPTKDEIKDAMSGLFNRATGYEQFYQAIDLAVRRREDPSFQWVNPLSYGEKYRFVGKGGPKDDSKQMVRGERLYVEDRVAPDSLHLKVLRSPYAHGRILRIEKREAEALQGVVAIFTHEDVPQKTYSQAGQGFPEPSPYDRMLLSRKVRHVGDRVAAVVAVDEATALKALTLIDVEYEVLQPVLDWDQAASPDSPLIHGGIQTYMAGAPEDLKERNRMADTTEEPVLYQFPIGGDPGKNIAASVSGGVGDIQVGFTEADIVLERTYSTTQIQCTPLEKHSCYAYMSGDRLIIHASTQVPYHVRRIVSTLLDLPENRVQVVKERVGGGYGSKQDVLIEDLVAFCAFKTGSPVFEHYSRDEEFIACSTRKPMRITVKLGAKNNGQLTSMYMNVESNQGPYGAHALTVPMNGVSKSLPLFLCDNASFDVTSYYSNIPPTGAYQGYGAPKANYAMQMAMAELAEKLKMDPLALIRKNMVHEGDMLEILKCLGEGREGKAAPAASCGLEIALKEGAAMIDWGKKEKSEKPHIKIGKGVVILQQGSGLPGLDQGNAIIKMLGDGSLIVQSGGADLGTGLDLVTQKMVAEVLMTPLEHITVKSGDSDSAPFDVGAYASSGTYFSGGAAMKGAIKMSKLIKREAALILGENEEDMQIIYPSLVKGKRGKLTFAQLAHDTQGGEGRGQIIANGSFTTEDFSFPYGAHFCQVAVNTRTGAVEVQKYYALQDCGLPINPEYAAGQVYGGVVKSMGHALYEEMIFDKEGRCLNSDLRSYGVPMIGDIPDDFRVSFVETKDPFGPFGAKSVAEISVNGAAPVIANAIHDALGIWIRDWPFSPESVLKGLGKI